MCVCLGQPSPTHYPPFAPGTSSHPPLANIAVDYESCSTTPPKGEVGGIFGDYPPFKVGETSFEILETHRSSGTAQAGRHH